MPSAYRWAVLAVTVVAFVQTHLQRMAFAPLIPTFVSDLGLTYTAAGTVQTAYFWTYALAQVPVGVIADRWGSRRVMAACMGLLALGALAFATSGSFAGSVAARMLVGLGGAAVWVPGMRLITEWFPPHERARAAGLMSAGGGIGGTLGLLVVPWLATLWGWRLAYGITALPAALTLLLIAILVRAPAAASGPAPLRGSLRSVLAIPEFWPLGLSVFLSYGGYFSFLTFLPAFLVTTLGASTAQAGSITGLITAGTIVSWPLAGWLSDYHSRRKPLFLASQVATAAGCAFFALAPARLDLGSAALATGLIGLVVGGTILPFVSAVELAPPAVAATASGVTNAASFAAGMVFPVVLGRVVDATGGFTAAFLLAAGLQLGAVLAGFFVRETGRMKGRPAR
jgi:MFS family permease